MQLPLFPLPNVVLFPNAIIPLHIFENRYQEMIDDILNEPEDERFLIITTQLSPGTTDADDNSEFHQIGTVGKLIHQEFLPDGRSNIVVLGLFSAAITEVSKENRETIYRQASITKRSEEWDQVNNYNDKEILLVALKEYATNHRYKLPDMRDHSMQELVPQLCFGLPLSIEDKLVLLEEINIGKRIEMLIQILRSQPDYIDFLPNHSKEFIN